MKHRIGFLIISSLFLTACSHTNTPGERMLDVSQESSQLGGQWNQGDKLAAEGTKLINKGEKLIAGGKKDLTTGRDMVKEGQQKVAQGIRLKKRSEISFNKRFPNYDLTSDQTSHKAETNASGLDVVVKN